MEKIEAIQYTSQVEKESKIELRCSGGGEEVEEAFHKSIDLVPTQLALSINAINKADWHLKGSKIHNFIEKVPNANLADGETKLPCPDHHLHLEDVALGDRCCHQLLQNLGISKMI